MDSQRYSRPNRTEKHSADDQSRERSRDLVLKRSKAVRGDHMEVLEILGKSDQSGHRVPIRMSKTTGFPGRTRLLPKTGGVAGGSKNAVSPGKTRFKVVKPGQFGAHFGSNRASLGAFASVRIESVLESDPKRPHPLTTPPCSSRCLRRRRSGTGCGARRGVSDSRRDCRQPCHPSGSG